MGKRWILTLLGAASVVMLAASLVGGPRAAVVFALLAVAYPPLLMLVGSERAGSARPAAWVILALLAALELGVAGLLAFRGAVVDVAWYFGLPPAAAIQVYGLFLAPLVVVALGYAWSFDFFCPGRQDVERLREAGRLRREAALRERGG